MKAIVKKGLFHLFNIGVSPYIDLHTHEKVERDQEIRIINLMLNEVLVVPSSPFSAGLHPWYADQLSLGLLSERLEQCLKSPDFFAIGEIGLDKRCGITMNSQIEIFEFQLKIAEEKNLPVIIHCVKAWEELIKITTKYHTTNILHGYNGGIQLTKRLLKKGFSFSIGKAILNSGSAIQSAIHSIPKSSLFCETDTAKISVSEIYGEMRNALSISDEGLREVLFENYTRLLTRRNTLG